MRAFVDGSCDFTSYRRLEDDGKSSCKNGEYMDGKCLCDDK